MAPAKVRVVPLIDKEGMSCDESWPELLAVTMRVPVPAIIASVVLPAIVVLVPFSAIVPLKVVLPLKVAAPLLVELPVTVIFLSTVRLL